jgi:uridine kinase
MVKHFTLANGLKKIQKEVSKIGKKQKVVIVGIAGGSGSGKGYVANKLGWKVLHADDYYFGKVLNPTHDYDSPDSLEFGLIRVHLQNLKKGITIAKPIYDFKKQKRKGWEKFHSAKVIIIEGLFVLKQPIRRLVDIAVFVDASMEVRLRRRLARDIKEKRAGGIAGSRKMFLEQAEPNYKKHITRTRRNAIIINNNEDEKK